MLPAQQHDCLSGVEAGGNQGALAMNNESKKLCSAPAKHCGPISRRDMLLSSAAGVAGAALAASHGLTVAQGAETDSTTAMKGKVAMKGRINHSICQWCFSMFGEKWDIDQLCASLGPRSSQRRAGRSQRLADAQEKQSEMCDRLQRRADDVCERLEQHKPSCAAG